mmetsp:Transcript_66980/g.136434  ORF Transcript_66980/g.136434 Transcript_66980/m.136434 type:complete len:117 (+) Transcript_66980:482-832(+)|eukprot:CAMPEP_0201208518 /NCGR_PEP_ID=MMETSP0851-20130426/176547_1 /ASSEMBLY_ACC=CAM_ASM_000631 /TAXON_ID=183588 /ORGANISM="Pseudo-nitzschia fraudulenta, Strain WWA7" /LENGTH=116 /DNA_ID=CAMNT_0047497077 /DNA_START=468 /DNA_END=818 /DNA_ORIENTATION=-
MGKGQLNFFSQKFAPKVGSAVIFDVILRFTGNRSAIPLSQVGPAAIAGNGHDPRFNWTTSIPAVQVAKHAQECLLGHILGLVVFANHSVAQQVNLISKSTYELRDGALVPFHALVD